MTVYDLYGEGREDGYDCAVREAQDEGDYGLADALRGEAERYGEAQAGRAFRQEEQGRRTADEAAREAYELRRMEAETRARYGDFRGYAQLGYTQEEIDVMTRLWRHYTAVK